MFNYRSSNGYAIVGLGLVVVKLPSLFDTKVVQSSVFHSSIRKKSWNRAETICIQGQCILLEAVI